MLTPPNEQRYQVEVTLVCPTNRAAWNDCAVSGWPFESCGAAPHTLTSNTRTVRGPCSQGGQWPNETEEGREGRVEVMTGILTGHWQLAAAQTHPDSAHKHSGVEDCSHIKVDRTDEVALKCDLQTQASGSEI